MGGGRKLNAQSRLRGELVGGGETSEKLESLDGTRRNLCRSSRLDGEGSEMAREARGRGRVREGWGVRASLVAEGNVWVRDTRG